MKNLKIGTRLFITFMIIIILFCATVAAAIWGLKRNSERYSEFYNVSYQVAQKTMNMRRGLRLIVKDLAFATLTEDSKLQEQYHEEINSEVTLLLENTEWLKKNITSNHELLDSFSEDINKSVAMQETIINLTKTDVNAAHAMLMGEYETLLSEAADYLITISDAVEKSAKKDYEQTVQMQEMLVMIQLGMAGGALVITLLLCTLLTRSITRPVHELEAAAGKIVSGNFDIEISHTAKDELGSLANAFKNMVSILGDIISDASRLLQEMANGNFNLRTQAEERYVGDFRGLLLSIRKLNRDLNATLEQINNSADQVASHSNQISYGAQALSQGATQQAASVEELAATITNISDQVKDTAHNALTARDQTNAAGNEVEGCNRQMHDMTLAMEEISRTSNEIGKIIKTIEDIAFQTNILALNAAVEASRAGTAGKGFAVVADEVRSLASKSSEASKDTAELIESSIGAVARGTQLAHSTADALLRVVDEVRLAANTVDKIADAAETQASAVEQVSLGVDQISNVVQMNSSTAVQSASASEELSSQADMLKNLVSKFKLREDGPAAAGTPEPDRVAANTIRLD